jgi:phosphatidylglycerophosphate synthase
MGVPTQRTSQWSTWANGITLSRLLAVPPAALAIFLEANGLALALFCFAVATDLADGRVARLRGEASPLGGLLDHATDAIFVAVGLLACAMKGLVPIALPPLILLAFAQYALDSRAIAGRPLRASLIGRWNGIAYFVLLGIPVVRDGVGLGWPPASWLTALAWLLVATTVVSIADRGFALLRRP